jgi:hypothetical protein
LKCFREDHGNEFALVSCDGDSMRRNKWLSICLGFLFL